jgi:hypothetical protein
MLAKFSSTILLQRAPFSTLADAFVGAPSLSFLKADRSLSFVSSSPVLSFLYSFSCLDSGIPSSYNTVVGSSVIVIIGRPSSSMFAELEYICSRAIPGLEPRCQS